MVDLLGWRATRDGSRPSHTVVVDGERWEVSLTFAELDRLARALGGQLQSAGQKGDRVLVLCPVSLEYTAAVFGCLYRGLVAVPAYAPDVGAQSGRLQQIVRDSGAKVGVTTHGMLPQLLTIPGLDRLHWIIVDRMTVEGADAWKKPAIGRHDLALLLYTSGSTATPKGVMLTHWNLLHAAQALRSMLGQSAADRTVVVTPPHHSASILPGITYPVYAGVPVTTLAPELVSERAARWLETMSRIRATISDAPNFLFDLAVQSVRPEERLALDLSGVRFIRNGGESTRADTIKRFEEYFAPCGLRPGTVRPGYGLSEAPRISYSHAGAAVTYRRFDREQLQQRGVVLRAGSNPSDGRRLVGQGVSTRLVRIEIVDPGTRLRCESGRVGEIWTSGPNVARGYWNQPEETRAAFEATFADTSEGPFFRTGDLGFVHEGELFITGRLKEVIVIRGRNLYPVDVEASLQDCHPALESHAAAVFSLDVADDERLAIIHEVREAAVRDQGEEIISAIRQTVSRRHGVQAHTVALVRPGSIPRIGQGKIGRAECRNRLLAGALSILIHDVLDPSSPLPTTTARAPRTATERALLGIWEGVLKVKGIGVDDTFADLGGDSLLSMQILLAIREAGLVVSDEDLFRHDTIASLSRAIDARARDRAVDAGPAVGSVPLTTHQAWLLEQSDFEAATAVLEAGRPLDPALLEKAIQLLMFHHDALRLRCYRTEEGWQAKYLGHTPPGHVSFADLSLIEPQDLAARVLAEIERVKAGLDAERGPMLRAGLIRVGPVRNLVVLAIHPVVVDGLSKAILVRDLDSVYGQLAGGQPVRLPPRTATIAQWLRRAAELARSDTMRREAVYWRRVIGLPRTTLPVDFPRQPRAVGKEQVVSAWLGRERMTGLHRWGRQAGTSVSDAVHYALARALSEELGTETVLLETSSHGRSPLFPDIDLSRTVGLLVRQFPVLLQLDRAADHAEGVRAVRAQMQAIPHHGLGYEILIDLADEDLSAPLAVGPNPPITLHYEGDILGSVYDGLELFRVTREWEAEDKAEQKREVHRHSHIDISASIEDGDLLLWVTYHDRAYRVATIERMTGRMIEILTHLGGEAWE
jgi:non-ribosomal peptide synthase protein (TIGR01720 family)